ncbi:MAG: hypothetical protein A4E73_02379 [Syntrophaceae bacterium PtaU1.Bin231]|nr:MAG: hypothetical protein A4E73_02379 [Syntrophaceae bacterium PtaU1.Bin231]HOG18536.1 amphi-Trp domain-containing protein [Syntrophales bacterium]
MASKHLKVKTTAGLLEVVRHLENLVAALKRGAVVIRKKGESITLSPGEPVSLDLESEIKLEKNTIKEKLVIELKWRKEEQELEPRESFSIAGEEPAAAEES